MVFAEYNVYSITKTMLMVTASIVIVIDIVVIIMHSAFTKIARKQDIKPHNKGEKLNLIRNKNYKTLLLLGTITVDIISLITFFYLVVPKDAMIIQIVMLIFCVFRLYRVVRYFCKYFLSSIAQKHSFTLSDIVSRTADVNNVYTLLKKYALLMVFIVHSYACVWRLLGCYVSCLEFLTGIYFFISFFCSDVR